LHSGRLLFPGGRLASSRFFYKDEIGPLEAFFRMRTAFAATAVFQVYQGGYRFEGVD
jgi:hypothetical protein